MDISIQADTAKITFSCSLPTFISTSTTTHLLEITPSSAWVLMSSVARMLVHTLTSPNGPPAYVENNLVTMDPTLAFSC